MSENGFVNLDELRKTYGRGKYPWAEWARDIPEGMAKDVTELFGALKSHKGFSGNAATAQKHGLIVIVRKRRLYIAKEATA